MSAGPLPAGARDLHQHQLAAKVEPFFHTPVKQNALFGMVCCPDS